MYTVHISRCDQCQWKAAGACCRIPSHLPFEHGSSRFVWHYRSHQASPFTASSPPHSHGVRRMFSRVLVATPHRLPSRNPAAPTRHWHTNPHQIFFKHSIALPPPAEELLSVFSSLCAEPFDAAEVRSSLWHLFYVSERFELDQMRQFKQVSHWHFSCHHPLSVTRSSRRRLAAHWSSRGCV